MSGENTWKECTENASALRVSPDKQKATSLTDTAVGRIVFLQSNTIKDSNANYIFEGYYSSALEMLHALMLLRGYKVANHICLGYYLRDVLGNSELFRLFDDCRWKRNAIIYYGRTMDLETAKQAIARCLKLIEEFELLVKNEKHKLQLQWCECQSHFKRRTLCHSKNRLVSI